MGLLLLLLLDESLQLPMPPLPVVPMPSVPATEESAHSKENHDDDLVLDLEE